MTAVDPLETAIRLTDYKSTSRRKSVRSILRTDAQRLDNTKQSKNGIRYARGSKSTRYKNRIEAPQKNSQLHSSLPPVRYCFPVPTKYLRLADLPPKSSRSSFPHATPPPPSPSLSTCARVYIYARAKSYLREYYYIKREGGAYDF